MPNDKSLKKPETAARQEAGGDHVSRLVRQFRRLEMGEIVLATDEIYDDHKREWVEPIWSVGDPAPDPAYTSHRQFRREINSLPNAESIRAEIKP
jgi:hypothetical protein